MNYAIIVAGGKGLRMGGDLPKQFLPVGGRPVLMRTLETFASALPAARLILVLPESHLPLWQELCGQYSFAQVHDVVVGGETRFHSVKNGLRHILQQQADGEAQLAGSVVGVHDGVRPFVSVDVIRRCYAMAHEGKAVVPVVPVVETLRELTSSGSRTLDRSRYRLVQTPQVFPLDMLAEAYQQPYRETFTDDASVVEALGCHVSLTEGNRENIKLTTPFDLSVADAIILQRATEERHT